jgi:hypothetical protein
VSDENSEYIAAFLRAAGRLCSGVVKQTKIFDGGESWLPRYEALTKNARRLFVKWLIAQNRQVCGL